MMMEKTLQRKYPESYERVLRLSAEKHYRIRRLAEPENRPQMDVVQHLAEYERALNEWTAEWDAMDNGTLLKRMQREADFTAFFNATSEERLGMTLHRNSCMHIFSFSESWSEEAKQWLKERINYASGYRMSDIVVRPALEGKGYSETLITDLQFNILSVLNEPMTYRALLQKIRPTVTARMEDDESYEEVVLRDVENLLVSGLLLV